MAEPAPGPTGQKLLRLVCASPFIAVSKRVIDPGEQGRVDSESCAGLAASYGPAALTGQAGAIHAADSEQIRRDHRKGAKVSLSRGGGRSQHEPVSRVTSGRKCASKAQIPCFRGINRPFGGFGGWPSATKWRIRLSLPWLAAYRHFFRAGNLIGASARHIGRTAGLFSRSGALVAPNP